MPTINITDALGFAFDVTPNPLSGIGKYLRGIFQSGLPELDLNFLRTKPLSNVKLKKLSSSLDFKQGVPLQADDTTFSVKAGLSGELRVIAVPGTKLFPEDLFDDPVTVKESEAYVGVGWAVSVGLDAENKTGVGKFGFGANERVDIRNFARFPSSKEFLPAISQTIKDFEIPGSVGDLDDLASGTVATVDGSGALKFAVAANVSTDTTLLATGAIGDAFGSLGSAANIKLKLGASLGISANYSLLTSYQVRIQKVNSNTVRLGYYRKKGSDFRFALDAVGGLSAQAGPVDLLEEAVKRLTGDETYNKEKLKAAGLSDEKLGELDRVIKQTVDHRLQASLGVQFQSASSDDLAFLYEIRLSKLDQDGVDAVRLALDGDLRELTGVRDFSQVDTGSTDVLPGIKLIRSITTSVREETTRFKFNFFGIYNYMSLEKLLTKSRMVRVGDSVNIVDEATAKRINLKINNLEKAEKKLRHLMSESVMVTAAYACSLDQAGAPDIEIKHDYFEMHQETNFWAMKDNLDVAQALGLITAQRKQDGLQLGPKFGFSTLLAETTVDHALATQLFLQTDAAGNFVGRGRDAYEKAGRDAFVALLDGDRANEYRLPPMRDDDLWARMKPLGPTEASGFITLSDFRSIRNESPKVQNIIGDYIVIVWWAESMAKLGESLTKLRNFLKANPAVEPIDPRFQRLRQQVGRTIKNVVKDTKERFGDPWGLIAMDRAGNKKGQARVKVTNEFISFDEKRV